MTTTSSVPRNLWEMTRERRASSEMRPPAFLIMWASPNPKPMKASGCKRASMHVTTAILRAGGAFKCPAEKSDWKSSLAALNSATLGVFSLEGSKVARVLLGSSLFWSLLPDLPESEEESSLSPSIQLHATTHTHTAQHDSLLTLCG